MDPCFWEELADLDPSSVCRRSGAGQVAGGYRLQVLDAEYRVEPRQRRITRSRIGADIEVSDAAVSNALELIIVHYLLNAKDIPLSGRWVGLNDLGSGTQFFVSHVPDFGQLLPLFASSPGTVEIAARGIGGQRLEYGDLSVEIRMLPRVPMAFVYWAETEEFASQASVMFDTTGEQHLPLDVMSAAIQEAIARLSAVASGKGGQ
jgi:hypothetical protein